MLSFTTERIAVHLHLVDRPEDLSLLIPSLSEEVFRQCYVFLIENYLVNKVSTVHHVSEISYVTMYRHVKKYFGKQELLM